MHISSLDKDRIKQKPVVVVKSDGRLEICVELFDPLDKFLFGKIKNYEKVVLGEFLNREDGSVLYRHISPDFLISIGDNNSQRFLFRGDEAILGQKYQFELIDLRVKQYKSN